ncbi:MAG: cardiolipin synthase [Lachnospiraceae bacterium]|nr:cardiolipin synthase [Lachnospiraceae bacterium]
MKKYTVEKKTTVQNSVMRLIFVAFSIVIQVVWLLVIYYHFAENYSWISVITSVVALVISIGIYSKRINSNMRLTWIMVVTVFPVFGVLLYLLVGLNGPTISMKKRFNYIDNEVGKILPDCDDVINEVSEENCAVAGQMTYLKRYSGFPVFNDSKIEYYSDALDCLEAMKVELKKAKEFIFIEYHAIEEAEAFNGILDILKQKVKEGVIVRIIYDDIGSFTFIDKNFVKRMEEFNIDCRIFNPMMPFFNVFLNNRDHRKITVIDGKVGFTGGFNLANEYFHITEPYGFWKDTGVKIEGNAVVNLIGMFLEMWNGIRPSDEKERELETSFMQKKATCFQNVGYIQPYADNPMDDEYVGENVYLNVINNAHKYVYFITPYLIITDEMIRALTLAAKRGVDVRIITPGVPDKKLTYRITRSFYRNLTESGVRIFEFTPGFCHAKQCISDDIVATCGTINLDYRSLYHHFENGVLMYKSDAIFDMKKDFEDCFSKSKEVTSDYSSGRVGRMRFLDLILRVISPLM